MIERIFVAVINGNIYRKDSAIRTYLTRERAEKETARFSRSGAEVYIGEFALTDLREITKEGDE